MDRVKSILKWLLALPVTLCLGWTGDVTGAERQLEDQTSNRLTVGVKEAPPFVMRNDNGDWTGISIELWRAVAEELGLAYELHPFDLQELRSAIDRREVDIVVGALSITPEREELVDFTHTYYVSSLGIAVPAASAGTLGALSFLVSGRFLQLVGGLALLLVLCGALLWRLERKSNPEQFSADALPGVGAGIWWAAVTMTTVGYGDKAPKSPAGRTTALIWMFCSLVLVSVFTGTVASVMTVSGLDAKVKGPEDLPRVRVASVASTASGLWLDEKRIDFVSFPGIEAALEALSNGAVDAVVYDRPILSYLARQLASGDVTVLPRKFALHHYGFVLPPESALRESINRAILEYTLTPEWKDTVFRYTATEI
jgi:ABC-type amino acid transport substrate-binding protein